MGCGGTRSWGRVWGTRRQFRQRLTRIGERRRSSPGFLAWPSPDYNPENVSAVLWTNAGTVPKIPGGWGLRDRTLPDPRCLGGSAWLAHDLDPNAHAPAPFAYIVGVPSAPAETWGQEATLFHNPTAKHPLPAGALRDGDGRQNGKRRLHRPLQATISSRSCRPATSFTVQGTEAGALRACCERRPTNLRRPTRSRAGKMQRLVCGSIPLIEMGTATLGGEFARIRRKGPRTRTRAKWPGIRGKVGSGRDRRGVHPPRSAMSGSPSTAAVRYAPSD